ETGVLFAAAIALLGGFAAIERRSAAPLIPAGVLPRPAPPGTTALTVSRPPPAPAGVLPRRTTLAPHVLQFLLGVSAISSLFLLTLYTQQVLGYTPLQAGIAYLPLAGGVASATAVGQRLVGRVGPRPLAIAGLAVAATGIALLGRAP